MSIVLAFEDDDEFVAADAVDRAVLIDAADGLAQALQGDVPLFVAKTVIDVLELVQVDHDHGKDSLAGGFTDVMQGPDDTVRRPDSQERRQQADDDGHSQDPEGHELAAGIDFPFRCRHAQFHAILQGRKAHGHGNALIVVMNQMGIRR